MKENEDSIDNYSSQFVDWISWPDTHRGKKALEETVELKKVNIFTLHFLIQTTSTVSSKPKMKSTTGTNMFVIRMKRVQKFSGLPSFWTLLIMWYFGRTQHFRNWIYLHPQIRGGGVFSVGAIRKNWSQSLVDVSHMTVYTYMHLGIDVVSGR